MRKIITIIIILAVLASVGFALFVYFGSKPQSAKEVVQKNILTKVSDDLVASPTSAYNNDSIWYFNYQGQLFKRSVDGSTFTEFSFPEPVQNFQQAYWPKAGNDLIYSYFSDSGSRYKFYDNTAKTFTLLPQNIQSLDWMPDGKRIVYIWKSGDGKSQQLVLANADTSGFRVIGDVFWPDLKVKVSPDGNSALLIRGDIQDINKIYQVDLATGKFVTLVDSGKNTDVEWLNSHQFVYSLSINNMLELFVYDTTNNQSKDLGLNANLDRVTVDHDGKYLYAVSSAASDKLYKVDLSNLQSQDIYTFDANTKPRNLFMSDQTVMFINSQDNKLYTLSQ